MTDDDEGGALRRERDALALALAIAKIGMWTWDLRTNRVTWSAQLARLVGHDGELHGTFGKYQDLIHPDDRAPMLARLDHAVRTGHDRVELDFRIKRSDGVWRRMTSTGQITRTADGRPAQMLAALTDVTERRALEERQRQAQRGEVTAQIAGGVARDLDVLLRRMTASYAALATTLTDDDPRRAELDELRDAIERGTTIAEQLLTLGRHRAHQPQAIDVAALVARLEPQLRRLAGRAIHVETVLAPVTAPVWADAAELEQVVLSLVANACDAMPLGGTLSVSVGGAVVDDAQVAAHPGAIAGPHVVLGVADAGHGIPRELLPRIVEPFFTTKEAGSGAGLGLPVVVGVARQCHGHLVIESEVGRGSTFRVFLPEQRP